MPKPAAPQPAAPKLVLRPTLKPPAKPPASVGRLAEKAVRVLGRKESREQRAESRE